MGTMAANGPADTEVGQTNDYTLKGVKMFRGMDGQGLNATLWRGTKKVAFILDEGCGGMIRFDWVDRMHGESKEEALFEIFIAEQKQKADNTKKDEFGKTEQEYFDGEHWVNALVDKMENDKRFRKACKTKTLFQVGDKVGSEDFMAIKGVDLKTRQYIEKKYAGQKIRILNDELKD